MEPYEIPNGVTADARNDAIRYRSALEELRPLTQSDGVEFQPFSYSGGTLTVQLVLAADACRDCILPVDLLEQILLQQMTKRCPEVRRIVVLSPDSA